jgi:hypothetical protein
MSTSSKESNSFRDTKDKPILMNYQGVQAYTTASTSVPSKRKRAQNSIPQPPIIKAFDFARMFMNHSLSVDASCHNARTVVNCCFRMAKPESMTKKPCEYSKKEVEFLYFLQLMAASILYKSKIIAEAKEPLISKSYDNFDNSVNHYNDSQGLGVTKAQAEEFERALTEYDNGQITLAQIPSMITSSSFAQIPPTTTGSSSTDAFAALHSSASSVRFADSLDVSTLPNQINASLLPNDPGTSFSHEPLDWKNLL